MFERVVDVALIARLVKSRVALRAVLSDGARDSGFSARHWRLARPEDDEADQAVSLVQVA